MLSMLFAIFGVIKYNSDLKYSDAIKEVIAKSNNISTTPRQTSSGEINVGGFKVKAINGVDSSKLKIKSKFNN